MWSPRVETKQRDEWTNVPRGKIGVQILFIVEIGAPETNHMFQT